MLLNHFITFQISQLSCDLSWKRWKTLTSWSSRLVPPSTSSHGTSSFCIDQTCPSQRSSNRNSHPTRSISSSSCLRLWLKTSDRRLRLYKETLRYCLSETPKRHQRLSARFSGRKTATTSVSRRRSSSRRRMQKFAMLCPKTWKRTSITWYEAQRHATSLWIRTTSQCWFIMQTNASHT